jgi:addiction module HigA family antidote
MKKMLPVHPGEILMEEFLRPLNISQYRLAKDINVPARRINEIVHKKRSISADSALRFGKYFGTSPEFWLNLQSHYDLEVELDKFEKKSTFEIKLFSLKQISPKYS